MRSQFKLFESRSGFEVAVTPEINAALNENAAVAIGVSGGKDSAACAFATIKHLDQISHRGPRILIHSDLGRVEWRASLPACETLAAQLGLELIVVRRQAGDLLQRWQTRWANNVARYANLECVKLILPWSTPSMRFCTSELKTAIISRALTQRFPGHQILSVTGIRRQESANRARMPISAVQKLLIRSSTGTTGLDWHSIIEWSTDEVFEYLAAQPGYRLHEAYTRYHSSRVSCAFCIMSAADDLVAASECVDNQDVYREMVALEADSTFSFQNNWLGDVAPHLLSDDLRERLARAKIAAELREQSESRLPDHLLYTKGWPTCIPTWEEAQLLSEVRQKVAAVVGLDIRYVEAAAIRNRYRELMELKAEKAA